MKSENEIRKNHKQAHDILSEQYYKYSLWGKAEFDQLHGENWEAMKAELIAGGFIKVPTPQRDPLAEIDELKAEVAKLKATK